MTYKEVAAYRVAAISLLLRPQHGEIVNKLVLRLTGAVTLS